MPNVDHIFNTPRQATFNPVVSTQVFPLPFPIYAASSQNELNGDFLVTVNSVVATGYTISGTFIDGVALDGSLSLAAGVSGVTVQVWSRRAPRTSQDLNDGGTVTPSELQAMFNSVITSQRDIFDWLTNLQSGSPFIPVGSYLPTAGGTMVGDLVLAGDPNANLEAATKQYVDNKFGGAQAWGGLATFNAGLLLGTGLATFNGSGALFNGAVSFKEQVLVDGANISWDMSLGVDAAVTLGGNRLLVNATNRALGQRGFFAVIQDATGNRTLSLDTAYVMNDGSVPIINLTPNSTTIFMFKVKAVSGAASVVLTQVTAIPGPHVILEDQKAANTSAQSVSSGVDTQLILNTLVRNYGNLVSLTSNQFTLPAGTYYISGSAPSLNVGQARAFIYNVTDAAIAILGTSQVSNTAGTFTVTMRSLFGGYITITSAKTFELRFRQNGTWVIGNPVNDGRVEVYSHVEITKV